MTGFINAEQQAVISVANAMKTMTFDQAVKSLVASKVLSEAYLNWTYSAFQTAARNLLANEAVKGAIGAGTRKALTAAAASGGRAIGALLAGGGGAMVLFGIISVLSAGALALAGYEGYRYYQAREEEQRNEQQAAAQQERLDERRREAQSRGQQRACPPAAPHKTMCPWAGGGYVGECGQGWCWDGGGHGTGACKLLEAPPNARRTYTRDVICSPGYKPEVDPCTGVLKACVPQPGM